MTNTARSVMSMSKQLRPVSGAVHSRNTRELPSLSVCFISTTVLQPLATRSIAPPMPRRNLPGTYQLAMSPFSDTCSAPSIVMSMWPPRIIAKDSALSNSAAPSLIIVTVCLPAFVKSGSTSSCSG
ncbi:hypothetical protein ABL78_8533 [Leptomonas seymouri]|uniref:Uncharacterized protein n=1 Tax=Leptomonas seymouri TaxID=5684 RepID=A0A0N0P2F5_LEPSE|nr:hypothetical protein ABL78_8533 [Leptomonas seymouri]|eukprot:KPI82457.1 hypothetical protein ABL78_8533 [Leptomonas seymouri]